ncbi:MAG TPA: P-loop NTPase [Gemmatimonadota bacterium]|nr:P-loop NTPase [Gemmatimonadota bacterium]
MADRRAGPLILAVGGGKGGVGKSFITASLAIALARQAAATGRRVTAVDLDFGGSNLNLFLGEPFPDRELSDYLDGRSEGLDAITQPTRLENLRYVAGSFDMVTAVDPIRDRKLDLVREIIGLEAANVLLDLPAGSTPATLDFFFLGDVKIVVTNPESTAFHNAYGFLKNYLLRRLLTEFRDRREIMHFILDFYRSLRPSPQGADRTITALVIALREAYPEIRPEVAGILQYDAPLLILNRARGRRDGQYLERFRAVLEKNLGLRCPALGVIPEDRRVARATRDARPFMLAHPRHRIARQFETWATRLAGATAGR